MNKEKLNEYLFNRKMYFIDRKLNLDLNYESDKSCYYQYQGMIDMINEIESIMKMGGGFK